MLLLLCSFSLTMTKIDKTCPSICMSIMLQNLLAMQPLLSPRSSEPDIPVEIASQTRSTWLQRFQLDPRTGGLCKWDKI